MPVTQYIGARYVPIIYQNPDDNSNDWKAGVPYEPLTIVSYAGGSYTSKSAVPAGATNPVDAPEYWVSIGLYSGQTSINTNNIDHIQHALANATEAGYTCTTARAEGDLVWINGILYECTAAVNVNDSYTEGINITQVLDALHTMATAVDQATSDVADLGNDLNTLDGTVTTLSGTVGSLQTQSNADHAAITSNGIKKATYAIWIGDSYTQANSLGADQDKRFATLVSNWLGLTEKNYAQGSCGFLYGANPYTTQIQNAIDDFTNNNLNKNEVKYVFVSSCRNDTNYGSRDDMNTAVRTIVSAVNTNFPNAHIYITPLLWDWKVLYYDHDDLAKVAEIKRAAHYGNNTHIIDYGWEWLMGKADTILWQAGADIHPTIFGHKIIADNIFRATQGNFTRRYEYAPLTPTTLNAGLSNFKCYYEVMDGFVNLSFVFEVTGGSDISSGTVWELNISHIYFSSFFIFNEGSDTVYFDIVGRDMNASVDPCCKAYLQAYCSKTDTTTGSMHMHCSLYGNGKLVNNHKYYANLHIPFGRKTQPRMP